MSDIVVYTSIEKMMHKRGSDGFQRYYWTTARVPKSIEIGDRIWFATAQLNQETGEQISKSGRVQGFFVIDELNLPSPETRVPHTDEMMVWDKDSWHEAPEKVEVKPFQGWRYRWWKSKVDGENLV